MLRKAYHVNMSTISAVKLSFTTETKKPTSMRDRLNILLSLFCYQIFKKR